MAATKEPAKGSHAAVSNIKCIIEQGSNKLAHLLEEKALGVTKRDREFKDTFTRIMLDAQRDQTEMEERGVKQSFASKPTITAICESVKSNIACSQRLLENYERASLQVAFGKRVSAMEEFGWQKDSQTLQRIISKQREKIMLEVSQLLSEGPKASNEQFNADVSDMDNDLWHRFAVGESKAEDVEALDGRKGETWAMIAKNAERGVRRIVQTLPEIGE